MAEPEPSTPVWERVDRQEVGEARIEQMRKMYATKATMPDKEAQYYDSVSTVAKVLEWRIHVLEMVLTLIMCKGGFSKFY